jgi:hypothetical protein
MLFVCPCISSWNQFTDFRETSYERNEFEATLTPHIFFLHVNCNIMAEEPLLKL